MTLFSVPPAFAQVVSPLQTGHYFPAITDVRDLVNPPPGFFILWYNVYAFSSGYIDRNGNKLETIRLSDLDDRLPDINVDLKLKAFATTPTVFWVSHFQILGGARYIDGIAPSYSYGDVSFITERSGLANPDTTITRDLGGTASGFGDLFVLPLGLSWGWKQFDGPTSSKVMATSIPGPTRSRRSCWA